ncbi:hypothetical protein FPJ21_11630 [Klebsiella pneumoniae]|uniref:Uncharacterized protein n=1 Tax=Klebsiella pneumoniae TaxID=573 RepID=A0A6B2J7T4_KLEPN|nr:hypothetical protein [Klebsiella pneumoniae]NDR85307.1 hypothetical protein [Klebsiella pneumoniae]NDS00961.1 hypothetical protein [Klebsiella pneumoniae]NDS07331.1 hypothetical protein [Klebsiella pneumoniae]NDS30300.1 hypothetical protein [Klebsiella pneumoniae]
MIDNFGWLDNASIPFSMSRIGAIVSTGIALYLIYSSSWAKAATVEIPRRPVPRYSYGHPGKALARRRLRQMFNEAFANLLVAVIFIKLMRSDSFFTT